MAIKAQKTKLKASTATGGAKTITGITAANPPVVSSTAHGFANGDCIVITDVVGMTEVNKRAFIVSSVLTDSFELKGVDGTGYTAYGSGGSATPQTMTQIGAISSAAGFDGQSAEIDVTDMDSEAKEFLVGLQDFGNVTCGMWLVTDTGQTKLRAIKEAQSIVAFTITLSDGRIAAFMASVKQFSFSASGPEAAVSGQTTLRVTGAPAWFA